VSCVKDEQARGGGSGPCRVRVDRSVSGRGEGLGPEGPGLRKSYRSVELADKALKFE